jgi:prevent-host-death family protein
MDITKDILPMMTFRNHSADILRHIRETKRPVILTVNGRAAAVVQDAEAYQRLPAREVFDALRAEYGIPR